MKKACVAFLLILLPVTGWASNLSPEQEADAIQMAMGVVLPIECGVSEVMGGLQVEINRQELIESGLTPDEAEAAFKEKLRQAALLANDGFDFCEAFKESIDSINSIGK